MWACWFPELIFSPSLEWKHKRIEFMMKKIYIHLRYMELCVCITDYGDIHKRELKDFWQLFCVLCDDTVTSETTSNEHMRQKKLAFLMWELTIVWKVRETATRGFVIPVNCIMGDSETSYYQIQCRKCQAVSKELSSTRQWKMCQTKPNKTFLHNFASSQYHVTAQFKQKRSLPFTLTLTSALYGSGWWRPRSGCFYPREGAGNNCTGTQVGPSSDVDGYRKSRLRRVSHTEPSTS